MYRPYITYNLLVLDLIIYVLEQYLFYKKIFKGGGDKKKTQISIIA